MLCGIMSLDVVFLLHYVVLCCSVLYCVVLCCAMLYYVGLCCAILYYVEKGCIMSYYDVLQLTEDSSQQPQHVFACHASWLVFPCPLVLNVERPEQRCGRRACEQRRLRNANVGRASLQH